MEVTISLDDFNKTYLVPDSITGNVLIISREKQTIQINLKMIIIGFYTFKNLKITPPQAKNVIFLEKSIQVPTSGYLLKGANNTYPFKFPLIPDENSKFYETYHGVSVSISYDIYAEVSTIQKYTSKKTRININVPGSGLNKNFNKNYVPYDFSMTPESIEKKEIPQNEMPKFHIDVHINTINCNIDSPFNGYIIIRNCSLPIKSLELQFMRWEKVVASGNIESSEIQNLQIGDGDVNKDIEIPLFMLFPRVFCCPTLINKDAEIKFEMNVIVVLTNGMIILENFPVNLYRN
jgi:hypothetical protein